ncbi:hypothetical protein BP5796_08129 [Coleophoma crateriformis]|uniref:Septation initiation network scaffold protein cdc11 n=1 Tax=Coleophoma crateriformis TaxID=565419 RepID=A0A3D8RDI2_9HELO|nr:hypothetical protein BP5796_08129 [Coleophoma crateriformis]
MDQAWLDSLSEDWVSQPRSPGSPAPSLPSFSHSTTNSRLSARRASGIPRPAAKREISVAAHDSSNNPLSERSANENNIPVSLRSTRQTSKLREELSNSARGRLANRRLSGSSTHSGQYSTVQHKSHSLSPKRNTQEIPEWKKRLLQGDVAYGEQRDLFSAAGLESIFRPPPSQMTSPSKSALDVGDGSTMPSSPPPYDFAQRFQNGAAEVATHNGSESRSTNGRQTQGVKYKMVDSSVNEVSENDFSQISPGNTDWNMPEHDRKRDSPKPQSIDSDIPKEEAAGRTVSGQSIFQNEELSPILLSKINTSDGKVDYTPVNVSAADLQKRLEKLSTQDRQSTLELNTNMSQTPLEGSTEDYAHNGHFVNLRRGGNSQEGSFQKRLLSTSSLPVIDESGLPEESIQASTPKQLPSIRHTQASGEHAKPKSPQASPVAPVTPQSSPDKTRPQLHKSNSGSPLKLFGPYDTFTNQKLLRRLSQFEESYDDNKAAPSPAAGLTANSAPVKPGSSNRPDSGNTSSQNWRRISSFGAGELDSYQFSEDVSPDANWTVLQEDESYSEDDEDKENISLPVLNPRTQSRFTFQLEPSPAMHGDLARPQRSKQASSLNSSRRVTTIGRVLRPDTGTSTDMSAGLPSFARIEDLETPRKRIGDAEGKRLQRSPFKDPTPKRRRTIPNSEIIEERSEIEESQADLLRDTHQQMQNVIGRKRKDARNGDSQQAAGPDILAMRQILRPRTPNSSPRGSLQHERPPLTEYNSDERAQLLQREKIARIQAELDSTNPLKTSMQSSSRKPSVTTQDFLDEAKKIMLAIRGKTRSGLASVEESESENDRKPLDGNSDEGHAEDFEDSYQESTQEPFSRPPSRDGGPVPRMALIQQDPEVLDHLRQYEEKSDLDDIIAASMRSIAKVKDAANAAQEIDRIVDEAIMRSSGQSGHLLQDDFVESDPPNIRITHNPDLHRKRKHSTSSLQTSGDEQQGEFNSHGSSASQSTTHSIPTTSSRGSDSRRVIAPHTVSHLIPEQLAGMVYDNERNIWVKRKSISGNEDYLTSDETEDDPFEDIPDLSVDESEELQRVKAVAARKKEEAKEIQEKTQERDYVEEHAISPRTVPGNLLHSGVPSPVQEAESSFSEHQTRNDSWAEESGFIPTRTTHRTGVTSHSEIRKEIQEEVEREISIYEDRIKSDSPQRRRSVTISFSSPIASIIQSSEYGSEEPAQFGSDAASDNDFQDETGNESIIIRNGSSRKSSSTRQRSALRSSSRRLSLGGHTFTARPVSRIDERDEEISSKEDNDHREKDVSLVISASALSQSESKNTSIIMATPKPRIHEIGTLELTPMSDFTMNQTDESFGLEVSYIAHGQRFVHGTGTKRALSHSIKDLVEKLTEVEPYEPFWEHMKQLDLKDKRISNLHKLDEFCEQVEELDVSNNQISQLNGAPVTIRNLRISNNCLSDLTAWGHLSNLQYIDISDNKIESLSAFRHQIHLRGLKADNNKIRSLDGISHLDGLLSLRLRGNQVEAVDFAGTRLQRLTDLDLKNNCVKDVRNIQKLSSLTHLNLEENKLEKFPSSDSSTPWSLKYLKLSGNKLRSLDVSQCPNLRLLYLDRNRLGNVTGFFATKHLDSLSMREQQDEAIIDQKCLAEAYEVRKLFLSGNLLTGFDPRTDFLNLQYLELANCGLNKLPSYFGQIFSNLRTLNLNFNALKDLTPLLGIVRLKKLHLAGNRITRLRLNAAVFHNLAGLKKLDLRNNPLTLGFYPPSVERQAIVHREAQEADSGVPLEPYTLADAEKGVDKRYAACLDMETLMRRRVYEMVYPSACGSLKTLDGLPCDKSALILRDKVWNALVADGVVVGEAVQLAEPQKPNEQTTSIAHEKETSENVKKSQQPEREVIWGAEDSFGG